MVYTYEVSFANHELYKYYSLKTYTFQQLVPKQNSLAAVLVFDFVLSYISDMAMLLRLFLPNNDRKNYVHTVLFSQVQ